MKSIKEPNKTRNISSLWPEPIEHIKTIFTLKNSCEFLNAKNFSITELFASAPYHQNFRRAGGFHTSDQPWFIHNDETFVLKPLTKTATFLNELEFYTFVVGQSVLISRFGLLAGIAPSFHGCVCFQQKLFLKLRNLNQAPPVLEAQRLVLSKVVDVKLGSKQKEDFVTQSGWQVVATLLNEKRKKRKPEAFAPGRTFHTVLAEQKKIISKFLALGESLLKKNSVYIYTEANEDKGLVKTFKGKPKAILASLVEKKLNNFLAILRQVPAFDCLGASLIMVAKVFELSNKVDTSKFGFDCYKKEKHGKTKMFGVFLNLRIVDFSYYTINPNHENCLVNGLENLRNIFLSDDIVK